MVKKSKEPDLSSVRSLVTSVTKLANHLKLSNNAIYRMIKVNRIPGRHIIKVAALYDVEVRDLLPLTGSDLENDAPVILKPKRTLAVLMEVYRKQKTLQEAATELNVSEKSLHLIMFHWGDELPTLYTTMQQLEEKRISLDEACQRLNVTKYTLHGIRRKYGYAPGKPKAKPKAPSSRVSQDVQRAKVIDIVAGRVTAEQACSEIGVSYRTIFRAIDKVSAHGLHELSRWPVVFRAAFAEEIDKNLPKYTEKWLELVKEMRLVLKKRPKYLQTPKNWKDLPLKRLLVGVLTGEATLEEIATSRGAYPSILAGLFTGDLRPLGVTYPQLVEMPVAHQTAVAEILMAMLDRKRVVPEEVKG